MTTDRAAAIHEDLAVRGFTIEAAADGRLWVTPADQLTEVDRASIREQREALYALVAAAGEDDRARGAPDDNPAAWPPIPCDWCGGEAVRDGRHLCRGCLAAWDAGERRDAAPGRMLATMSVE